MTFDIQLSLILLGAVFCMLLYWTIVPPFIRYIKRRLWWHRVRPYSDRACYIHYRENVRRPS